MVSSADEEVKTTEVAGVQVLTRKLRENMQVKVESACDFPLHLD